MFYVRWGILREGLIGNPINFDEIKQQFLIDICAVVEMEDIPPSLVINWNHTAAKIVLSSQWTMERKGMKRMEIAAVDDKRQITAIFACMLSGKLLPIQLIYQGTTPKYLSTFHLNGVLPTQPTTGRMRIHLLPT